MKKAQSTIEYMFLIALVVSALVGLLYYVSRSIQGNIRDKADQLSVAQFEQGKTNVDNVETKHVDSTVRSATVTTTVYANRSALDAAEAKVQEESLRIRKIEKELDRCNYNLTKQLEFESQQRLADMSSGLSLLWQDVKTAFSSDTGGAADYAEQLEDARASLKSINEKQAELNQKLIDLPSGPDFDERKATLEQEIEANKEALRFSQWTYDTLILKNVTSNFAPSTTEDQNRVNTLVPSGATTTGYLDEYGNWVVGTDETVKADPPYDSVAQAIYSIEDHLNNATASSPGTAPSGTFWDTIKDFFKSDSSSNEDKQARVDVIYTAITENTPPPPRGLLKATEKSAEEWEHDIKVWNAILIERNTIYKQLEEDAAKEREKLKDTKSTQTTNRDESHTTTTKITKETLGNL